MKLWKRVALAAMAGAYGALTVGSAVAAEESTGSSARVRRAAQPAVYWAYQPVQKPQTPEVGDGDWVRTPVDAFVLAKLQASGLAPSPEADRATFARRVYLDVLGLIPTPEQVQSFVADRSPQAYEQLIDGLLASPQYGERIGRKWLDLARYADTQGYQDDETRPGAWRYRDYVVESFNADKPFDRFVREQLAGDELWPDSQEALTATGFLRNYPDGPDHRDMLERRYNSITDMTDTVGSVFLGHSLECARCHDHKFDKISQKEYFQLQSFFTNTLPSDSLPVKRKGEFETQYEKARAAWEAATAPIRGQMQVFIEPHRAEIDDYHYTRFYENAQVSLRKPKEQWQSQDRWVNYRYHQYIVRNNPDYGWDVSYFAAANGAFRDIVARDAADPGVDPALKAARIERAERFRELLRQFRAFDTLKPVQGATIISGVIENGTDAAPQFIYMGGNQERPLDEVQPGFPAAITPGHSVAQVVPTAHSSGRRTALANWIASADNPLTARVFVNRVWEMLFAQGIVNTPSDIGRASQKPSHPELLDYLAARFVEQGWSVKELQREILLSATYRQSSAPRADAAAVDPLNQLLAVFPRRRLDAEQVRDSLLAAAGVINLQQGGPAVYPEIPESVMKESTRRVEGFWPVSKELRDHHRRSLYIFTRRSVPFPMLEVFDRASPQVAHARRDVSTTPQQSLTLFNNEVVYGWSHDLAARAAREATAGTEAARIGRLFQILFARQPDATERAMAQQFLEDQERVIAEARSAPAEPGLLRVDHRPVGAATGIATKGATTATPREQAFVDLAHTLANSNEFIYRY